MPLYNTGVLLANGTVPLTANWNAGVFSGTFNTMAIGAVDGSSVPFVGTNTNASFQIGVNSIIKAQYDTAGNYLFGGVATQLGLLSPFNPTNLRSTQYAADGSIPYAFRVISEGVLANGLSVETYVASTGGCFSRSVKGRGTPTSPMGVNAGDIIWGHGAQAYLNDISNASGSIAGYHYIVNNAITSTNQQTEQQYFVNNASGRRYTLFMRSTGASDFYDTTTSTWNPVNTGTLTVTGSITATGITSPRINGVIDNWASDMTLGAVDATALRTVNTNKVVRMGVQTYVGSGASTNSLLALGLNTVTDNLVYLGGGSSAYYAATQLNFYTASVVSTVTGTLAMRVNNAQNVLIGSAGTDDGSTHRLQIADATGGVSITGTLADQKRAIRVVTTLAGGTVSNYNAAQDMQVTSINQTSNAYAFNMDLLAGATDAHVYGAGRFVNAVAGTGANLTGIVGNYGLLSASTATTAGYNVASYAFASGGNISAAFFGRAITAKNSATNIGGAFIGRNTGTTPIQIGVYAGLNTSTDPTFVSAALLADNSDQTSPIAIFRANGTEKYRFDLNGNLTNTAGTATAYLHLKAGTASASTAPLKLTSGTNLTVVESGAIEFDGTDYFASANAARQTLLKGKVGSFSQVGAATTVFTVTFGGTQPNSTYKVNVTPTALLSAAAFYVTNKTTTTFDVTYVAGLTGTVTFDYSLFQ